jgi:hypothetical protein
MKQQYVDTPLIRKTLRLIEEINDILEEYAAQGFTMTVRQLFYQFVARGLLENTFENYKLITRAASKGRLAGRIDWDHIEDRTRALRRFAFWDKPKTIIDDSAYSYREDVWEGQQYRPEVWIEKAALLGVIEGVCREHRVPYFASIGNNSQSEQRKAGERFKAYIERGLTPIVLHLGDHDPNGLDMTRDNQDRLALLAGDEIEVRRIALNMDQVRQYNPPSNFAKENDNHLAGYIRQFGTRECWELDALSPPVIADLIRVEIEDMIDWGVWDERIEAERGNRRVLTRVSKKWPRVRAIVGRNGVARKIRRRLRRITEPHLPEGF